MPHVQWHALIKPLRDAVSIATPFTAAGADDDGQKANSEAASAKLYAVTHACVCWDLVILTNYRLDYTPATYHGQDSGRGGNYGLGLKAHVRKVRYLPPRGKNITPWLFNRCHTKTINVSLWIFFTTGGASLDETDPVVLCCLLINHGEYI